jgi:hypothetical protein
MKRKVASFQSNVKLARQLWGEPSRIALRSLRELTARYSLSVAAGDLQLLDGRWYVTHSGLLQLASRRGCRGINTILQARGAELRIAETRAVNRALRKAYGIGLCFGRRVGCVLERAETECCFFAVERFPSIQRIRERSTQVTRSALPFDPSVQPRCQSRKSLCRGLLRHRKPQRRYP